MQPLQGVHSLMAVLLCAEQLDQPAVELLQLRLLDLPGVHINSVTTVQPFTLRTFKV